MCTDQEQGPVAPLAPSATPSSLLAPARRGGELQSTSLQPLIENSATSSFPIPPADWDSFRDGMRHCAWYLSAEHGASFLYGSTVGELYANASNGTLTSQMPPAPLSTCQWTSDEDELWVARRIGPFTSTGGYPWYDLQVTDEWPELSAVLRERSETWLTGISTLTTDAKAEVLGFPPMHMHHSHVRKRDSQMPLILNHQDRVCGEPELRSRCFLTLFPEPYGLLLDQNLVMDSVFNDVRTAGNRWMLAYLLVCRVRRQDRAAAAPAEARVAHEPVDVVHVALSSGRASKDALCHLPGACRDPGCLVGAHRPDRVGHHDHAVDAHARRTGIRADVVFRRASEGAWLGFGAIRPAPLLTLRAEGAQLDHQ